MKTLVTIFLIVVGLLLLTWFLEERPGHFYEPEPFFPVQTPRYWRTSKAGGLPPRKGHRV